MAESRTTLMTKLGLGGVVVLLCALLLLFLAVNDEDAPTAAPETEPAATRGDPAERDTRSDQLVVVRVDAVPPVDDPFDARWNDAPPMEVPVQAQVMTSPRLDEATIDHVTLQAMNDGRSMTWRLSWEAAEPATRVATSRFSDAVAVQFPLARGAPFIMGSAERPVHILYWKAQWQRDIDEGYQDVQDLHPNFWSDLYWFARGQYPYPIEEAFEDDRSHQWLSAHAVDNPVAQLERAQPVQEMRAAGFGTLTDYADGHATGRGEWRDGRWAVVIERTLNADDELARRLAAGEVRQVALAVWDGSAGNVGGRKHWAMWVPIKMEPLEVQP